MAWRACRTRRTPNRVAPDKTYCCRGSYYRSAYFAALWCRGRVNDVLKRGLAVAMLAYSIMYTLATLWRDLDLAVQEGLDQLTTLCLTEILLSQHTSVLPTPTPYDRVRQLLDAAHARLPSKIAPMRSRLATKAKLPDCRKSTLTRHSSGSLALDRGNIRYKRFLRDIEGLGAALPFSSSSRRMAVDFIESLPKAAEEQSRRGIKEPIRNSSMLRKRRD